MPPKKAPAKAKPADKTKVVEDKTFGLKNKNKSKVVQKYVQQIQASTRPSAKQQRLEEPSRKDKKKAEMERQKELDELFMMTIKQPKVPPGVDPKTIVCELYRHNRCTKGFKCRFSHDLSVERKGPKASIYESAGGAADEEEAAGMEDWSQAELEKAIAEKHGRDNKNLPTQIICKYFLDAVEKRQYGWFWACPNGKDCKYRHALPPGYVLKSQMKELLEAEAAAKPSVEEVIEKERAKVDAQTPVTDESFAAWREAKQVAKREALREAEEERRRKGILTGREIFQLEGFEAADDLGASDATGYAREYDEEAEFRRAAEAARGARPRAPAPPRAGPSRRRSSPTAPPGPARPRAETRRPCSRPLRAWSCLRPRRRSSLAATTTTMGRMMICWRSLKRGWREPSSMRDGSADTRFKRTICGRAGNPLPCGSECVRIE
ncbi:hypothetical protein QBZ16_003982 [Prototheca wickerhamii]|uniref:C3H1-type domain-containing protein n=1 Tax=Prototheca wickerhamii TaxID=3111 RepID=A0AAD9IJ59_PROWI|nr:hypothetical protein QBZ16_003982 [Prototheca wickerhamii]